MPALSFVLLKTARPVDAAAVAAAYRELFDAPLTATPGEVLELSGDDLTTFVTLLPAAIPGGEAEGAARQSLSAFGPGFTLPPYSAHLMVASMDEDLESAERLTLHTHRVAALVRATGAVGVYEGNGHATHEPEFYVEVATTTRLPVMVWNGISFARTESHFELLSLGMSQLGLPDLLLATPHSRSKEALPIFFDLLAYMASFGQEIPEGDTIGRTAEERLPVHYVPSPIDSAKKVARIELQSIN